MRNLITGIFTVLAGTAIFYGKQALDDNQGKSRDQIKAVQNSATYQPAKKTPAPLDTSTIN